MDNIKLAKNRKQDNEDAGIEYYCSMSMYDIRNALTEKSLPLSDNNGNCHELPYSSYEPVILEKD
jgi:hypothetical protein